MRSGTVNCRQAKRPRSGPKKPASSQVLPPSLDTSTRRIGAPPLKATPVTQTVPARTCRSPAGPVTNDLTLSSWIEGSLDFEVPPSAVIR